MLFGLISFWALREFITLTPTRPGDHRTLFWVFFLCTPLQFWLVGMGYYEWYSIVIPVYAFLFIPARIALAGDYKRFLERTAKIQSRAADLRLLPELRAGPADAPNARHRSAAAQAATPRQAGGQRPRCGCCSSSSSWCN